MADVTEKILLNIQLNSEDLQNKLAKIKIETLRTNEAQIALTKSIKESLSAGDTASAQKSAKVFEENRAQLQSLGAEQRNYSKQLQLTQDIEQAKAKGETDNLEFVRKARDLSQLQLNKLAGTIKQNADGTSTLSNEYKKASATTLNLNDTVIKFGQGIKDGRANVGNYTESFKEAITSTNLFGSSLNQVKDVFNGTREGMQIVRAGIAELSTGFEGIKNFTVSAAQNVKTFFTGFNEVAKAKDEVKEVEGAVAGVGPAAEVGAKGFQLLKVAIASTGIGLLVIAIGALIALFQKSEAAAEFLERAFSGIGAVVDVLMDAFAGLGQLIVNAFTKPQVLLKSIADFLNGTFLKSLAGVGKVLKGIVTLDFGTALSGVKQYAEGFMNLGRAALGAGKSIGNIAANAVTAAIAAAKLKKEQQDFEDQIRNQSVEVNKNNKAIESFLLLSKDINVSTKDRLEALRQATTLETKNSEIKLDQATKEIDLEIRKKLIGKQLTEDEKNRFTFLVKQTTQLTAEQQKELDIFQIKAFLRDKDLQDIVDKQNKFIDVVAEHQNTEIQINKRTSQAKEQIRKEDLSAIIGILDDQLKLQELTGQRNFELQRQIAGKQMQEQLADDSLSKNQRLKIQTDYEVKLAEIKKSEIEFQRNIQNQIEDSAIAIIADGKTREIAQETVALQRKLDAIKGSSELEGKQREAIIQESSLKIVQIQNKFDQEDRDKTVTRITEKLNAEKTLLSNSFTEKENQLKTKLSQGQITQAEFDAQEIQNLIDKLAKEVQLQILFQQQRESADLTQFEKDKSNLQQKLDDGVISQQAFNDTLRQLNINFANEQAQTEKDTQQPVLDAINALNQAKVDSTITANNAITENTKKHIQEEETLNQLRLELSGTIINGIAGLLSSNEKNQKEFGVAIKALGVAEIAINLQKELSAIAAAAAANPLNAITFGGAGTAQYGLQSAISIARAVFATQRVLAQKFEQGGKTEKSQNSFYSFTFADAMKMISGNKEENFSFSDAMNYVAKSNSSFKNGGYQGRAKLGLIGEAGPEYVSPNWMISHPKLQPIFQSLENIRRTKVLPFADGGFTSVTNSFPVIQQAEANQNVGQDIITGLRGAKFGVIVQDINEAQATVIKVEAKGII